jgi:hypothetical protein
MKPGAHSVVMNEKLSQAKQSMLSLRFTKTKHPTSDVPKQLQIVERSQMSADEFDSWQKQRSQQARP